MSLPFPFDVIVKRNTVAKDNKYWAVLGHSFDQTLNRTSSHTGIHRKNSYLQNNQKYLSSNEI